MITSVKDPKDKSPIGQGLDSVTDSLVTPIASPAAKKIVRAKDEPEVATAKTKLAENFDEKANEKDDSSLSLYALFLLTQSPEQKASLENASDTTLFKAIQEFVEANPAIRDFKLSEDGKTIGQFVSEYDPKTSGSAKEYFSGRSSFKADPNLHIGSSNLWDETLSKYRQSSEFGHRHAPTKGASSFHKGIDLATPIGTDLKSEGTTQVAFAGKASGYGNAVILSHGDGVYTLYGHLSQINVGKGQTLRDGQKFADSGNTGVSSGAHLHLEVLVASKGRMYSIDPELVADGKVNLSTPQGREQAISLSARHEGVAVAQTASRMGNNLGLAAPALAYT